MGIVLQVPTSFGYHHMLTFLISGGSKGGMKVGGVEEISPNIVESTIGTI